MNKNSDPPLNRARCQHEAFDGKDRLPPQGAISSKGNGTDTKGGTECVEKATSSNQVDIMEHQADKLIWTPLTGWINPSRPAAKCVLALDADPTHKIGALAPRMLRRPAVRNQTPLGGGSEKDSGRVPWTKDPDKNGRNEPDSDDSEERRRKCPLCYDRVHCYCAQSSDSDN